MKNIFLILSVLIISFSNSQNCNSVLSGKISDFHDGSTLENATIKLVGTNKVAVSDKEGIFRFKNLCDNKYMIEISHIACETQTLTIEVYGDTFKSIKLEHHLEELNEVIVKSKEQTVTKTAQETVLKADVLKRYSNLSLGDALKEVPGVSSINTGNTIVKPIINGMHSSRLLILNNNVRLQDQEWGIEHAPNIDINSANQISVIKGSGALAHGGDAIGGVIVINSTRVIAKDTLYGKTRLSGQTNGRGFNFSTVLNKSFASGWYANFQGTLRQNSDFEAPDYVLSNTGAKSQGFTFGGGKKTFKSGVEFFYSYLNNEIGILRASHIGNITDLVNAINSPIPLIINELTYDINAPKQDVTHHLVKGVYYKRFENFGKVSLQYDYQNNRRFEFDIRRGDDRDKPAVDLNLQTHTLLADVNLDANLERKINFGFLARYQNNFASPDTGVRRLIPDYDKYDFGAYLTSEFVVNDKLTLDGGFRYDFNKINAKKFYRTSVWEDLGYNVDFADIIIEEVGSQLLVNPVFNYHNLSISIGAKLDVNDHSYMLANYGLSSRAPNPSELFSDGLHHSAARIELGDLRIDQETSNRVSLSYNYSKSSFNLLLEGFYNKINDFIYIEPSGVEQTIRGAFPEWQYIQSDSELYGLDLSVDYNILSNVNISNKSSYTRGTDNGNNKPLIDIPAFNTFNTLAYSNSKWNDFKATLTSEWIFEQERFPDNNFSAFIPSLNQHVEVDINGIQPAYHLLHFYSEITLDAFKNTNLNISLGVNNILNTQNRDYLNQLRYFTDNLGRNIVLHLQLNY